MSSDTQPSTGDWEFAVPPNWPAPPGFDPRKGHVADPTWPSAPPDWQFWVRPGTAARPDQFGMNVLPGSPMNYAATARPTARRGYQVPWLRVLGGVGIAIVVGLRLWGGPAASSGGDGVGSCWAVESGSTYRSVPCSSGLAQYQVVSTVLTPTECPASSGFYLEAHQRGSVSGFECLVPLH
jgi:hypothetical protein